MAPGAVRDLLHDMGSLCDGIEQGDAQSRDQDGAARRRVAEAILGHTGEAKAASERLGRLDATERQQLLDFLATI